MQRISDSVNPLTGELNIPEDSIVDESTIKQQLAILESKVGKSGNSSKVQKVMESSNVSSKRADVVSLATGETLKQPSNYTMPDPVEPECPPKPAKVTTQSLSDFFKERSQKFRSKDGPAKQVESPEVTKPVEREVVMPTIPINLQYYFPTVLPRGQTAEKLKKAAPYNMFLTTVTDSPATYVDPLSVTFLDLLDPSLGELESSVQINFVVDINWLLAQYSVAGLIKRPLLIVHGRADPNLDMINKIYSNVTSIMVKVPFAYGCHHTKMMLLFYKDQSMRVVVSTANLYAPDWNNRTQGLWMSERLPATDATKAGIVLGSKFSSSARGGESSTNFRSDLIDYLTNYEIPSLQPYIDRIKATDFRSVNVFLVTSVPGWHTGDAYGLPRLGSLLRKYCAAVDSKYPIVMQSSSVGNFGPQASSYLTGEVAQNLKLDSSDEQAKVTPEVKLIYPTLRNVQQSFDGVRGADCLPYRQGAHDRQPWLNQHLCQWKSQSLSRSKAVPHIKSYCRFSENAVYWHLMTSHNLSKSAWGVTKKRNRHEPSQLNICNYEAGVAFFPRVILGLDHFPMSESENAPVFRLPFDVSLVPYASHDVPFCMDSPGGM